MTRRKHEKRHTKPYGCAFHGCDKLFGSKNDWKRHSSTQHSPHECWVCVEPVALNVRETSGKRDQNPGGQIASPAIGKTERWRACAIVSYAKEDFLDHLKMEHRYTLTNSIREKCSRQRLDHQKSFWCGFCEQIIGLKKKGLGTT